MAMVIAVKHHSALTGTTGRGLVKRSPFIILVMFSHQKYELTERIRIFANQKNAIHDHTFMMI
jgi:hypothetical protein